MHRCIHEHASEAHPLIEALHCATLSNREARKVCEAAVCGIQDTPHLPAGGWADTLMRKVICTKNISTTRRDQLLSVLIHVLWRHNVPVDTHACWQALRWTHARYMPLTRRILHLYLLKHTPIIDAQTQSLWRAMLRSHVQTTDWHRVDETLHVGVALGALNELDVYHYTLRRLRHETCTLDPHSNAAQVLSYMRQSGTKLDDSTLAQLMHTLVVPVRRAHRMQVSPDDMLGVTRPVRRILQTSFLWICGSGASRVHKDIQSDGVALDTSRIPLFRCALSEMLELELFLAYANHMAFVRHARKHQQRFLRQPDPPVHVRYTEPIRRKVAAIRLALDRDRRATIGSCERSKDDPDHSTAPFIAMDIPLVRLDITLQASHGAWAQACDELRAWVARDTSAQAVYEQRRAIVTLFSFACKHGRLCRLYEMLEILIISEQGHLWCDGESMAPGATLVRLWLRFVGAWTHGVGVRCGMQRREEVALGPYGWMLMSRALDVLMRTAMRVPVSWACVLDHPERCRALVRSAVTANGDVDVIFASLKAMKAPSRVWRWAEHALEQSSFSTNRSQRTCPNMAGHQAPTPRGHYDGDLSPVCERRIELHNHTYPHASPLIGLSEGHR